MISLYLLIGKAIFPAMIIMFLILLANYLLTLWYDRLKKNYMKVTDQRGKLVNEIFKNIRFIKMVGLETFYLSKLVKLRNEELSWLVRQFVRNTVNTFINTLGPALFMIILWTTKIIMDGTLVLSKAFVAGMIFSIFQGSLRSIGFQIVEVIDCIISGRRICFFLLSHEVDDSYILKKPQPILPAPPKGSPEQQYDLAIEIHKGNFYWQDREMK